MKKKNYQKLKLIRFWRNNVNIWDESVTWTINLTESKKNQKDKFGQNMTLTA